MKNMQRVVACDWWITGTGSGLVFGPRLWLYKEVLQNQPSTKSFVTTLPAVHQAQQLLIHDMTWEFLLLLLTYYNLSVKKRERDGDRKEREKGTL